MNAASPITALAIALVLTVVAGRVWSWQRGVAQSQRDEIKPEAWELVQQQYPTEEAVREAPSLTMQALEAVVEANPFSASRHMPAARPSGQGTGDAAPGPKAAPKFRYKGHINMGARQRAIVEDVGAQKTYFLEVGQEVAGFKVLDILENRVVLSDPQTSQEVVVSLVAPEAKP